MKSFGVELEDFPEGGITLSLSFEDDEISVARDGNVLIISACNDKDSFVKRYSLANEQVTGWTVSGGVIEIR